MKVVPKLLLEASSAVCTILLWLLQLPHDLGVAVDGSAPGSLHIKLQQLPETLRALSAHAHIPGLASACIEAWSDMSSTAMHTLFVICVAKPAEAEAALNTDPHPELSTDSIAAAPAREILWLHAADPVDADCSEVNDLFTLQQQEGCAACCMQAHSATVQNITIELQPDECIVLGRDSISLAFSNVAFKVVPFLFAAAREFG